MTEVIAHRGASAAAPENTVAAFRLARELGRRLGRARRAADARRDGRGAHDAQLPDGRVIVETASGDLPRSIPSLAEALDACDGMGVNIEIKNQPVDPDFDPDESVAAAVVAEIAATVDSRDGAGVVVPPPDHRPGPRARRSHPDRLSSFAVDDPVRLADLTRRAWPRRAPPLGRPRRRRARDGRPSAGPGGERLDGRRPGAHGASSSPSASTASSPTSRTSPAPWSTPADRPFSTQ